MNAREVYTLWMNRLGGEDPLRAELKAIEDNEEEIKDRFYKEIVFGTAGLRGKCGAGTNRMNTFTVGRATQGLANYILKSGDPRKGVAIAYDCRYYSREFSELAAEILAGNGIKAYLFTGMRPTPELSFAVRSLGCISGINMTASHNPKEYNGYKVYWSDGAQISGEVSDGILSEIQKLDFFDPFPRISQEEAMAKGLLTMIDDVMDRPYMEYVLSMCQHEEAELDKSVKFVYTPLNGAGAIPVSQVMQKLGYKGFHMVPEQEMPDPEFTTVGYPNPEDPKGFELAEKLGKKVGAEVLIATDPDCDRMAVEVLWDDGEYHFLNGNQTGAMLIAYMAEAMKKRGTLPKKGALIKSIVTGDMGKTIAENYGIKTFETLTGFKNICGKIPEVQKQGYTYFFGYEESIGCAPGEAVRDKDGVLCSMLVAEMTAYYKKKGMTLKDALWELYKTYGYFSETDMSLVKDGVEGSELIQRIMSAFRDGKPTAFGPFSVEKTTDYTHGCGDIPPTNALRFDLGKGFWFAMRPSGTEPKLKLYFYAVADDKETSEKQVKELKKAVTAMIEAVR